MNVLISPRRFYTEAEVEARGVGFAFVDIGYSQEEYVNYLYVNSVKIVGSGEM